MEDGPRLKKLKDVYKRAIHEIVKEEKKAGEMIMQSIEKDSFYDRQSECSSIEEDIGNMFREIKERAPEILKEKIKEHSLDFKLNKLDKDIKESRIACQDIKDEKYIKEIYDSYIVDKKEDYINYIENEIQVVERYIKEKEENIKKLEEQFIKSCKGTEEMESTYQNLISEMEKIANLD